MYCFIWFIQLLELILTQRLVVISETRGCSLVAHPIHLGKPRMKVAGQREGGEEGEGRNDLQALSKPVVPTLFQLVGLFLALLKMQ